MLPKALVHFLPFCLLVCISGVLEKLWIATGMSGITIRPQADYKRWNMLKKLFRPLFWAILAIIFLGYWFVDRCGVESE
jgi:hypothetical protein